MAQCCERPLWRTLGDVDFYLSESNYKAAKALLTLLAIHVEAEDEKKNLSMKFDPWVVELHGTMHTAMISIWICLLRLCLCI